MFGFSTLLTIQVAAIAAAASDVQSRQLLGTCGLPALQNIACVVGVPIGLNAPVQDLTCNFTLTATMEDITKTIINVFDGGGFNYAKYITFQASPSWPMAFSLKGGAISAPVAAGRGYTKYLIAPASYGNSALTYKSLYLAADSNRQDVPLDGRVSYKCINNTPSLVLQPPQGKIFLANYKSWIENPNFYNPPVMYDSNSGDGIKGGYAPIDVQVNLIQPY